jgi:modulator of FtsH protease HflC
MKPVSTPLMLLLGGLFFLLVNSLFIVNEREQAVVFQFGQFKATYREPGLKFKIPLLQNVQLYPKQALQLDPQPQRVVLADKKILIMDSFAYYRISDPLRFFQNLKTEAQAENNIGDRINSTLKEVLSQYPQSDVLSPKRTQIMEQIRKNLNAKISTLGVSLTDVRIGRAELPQETSEAVYARMVTEREREAKQLRAEGEELAQRIRAKADKERTVLLAEAERDAQKIRGQGDADATRLYADVMGQNPDFYHFYRSLEAYKKTMADKDTTMILSPSNDFFKYFQRGAP